VVKFLKGLTILSVFALSLNLSAKLAVTVNFNYSEKVSFASTNDKKVEAVNFSDASRDAEYILIRTGLESFTKKNILKSIFYNKSVKEPNCSIKNNYLDKVYTDTPSIINKKINAFYSCLSLRVSSSETLEYDAEMPNCDIDKISENQVMIMGGECFFKNKNPGLNVEIVPNPECADRKYLEKNQIEPMTFVGTFEAYGYKTNELGPVFEPVSELHFSKIFLNINPGEELFPIDQEYTETNDVIDFPNTWILPNAQITNLEIKRFNETYGQLKLTMFLDVFGPNFCQGKLCSSPNNFDIPFAPEISIYEVKTRKNEWLHSGVIGGRVQNQWKGEFRSTLPLKDPIFEENKRYRIELTFSDPYGDYQALKNYMKKQISFQSYYDGIDRLRVGRDEFNVLGDITSGIGIGELPTLGEEMFEGLPESLKRYFKGITKEMSEPYFIPNYSRVCDNSGKNCRRASKRNHLVLALEFTISGKQGPKFKFKDMVFEKKSPLAKGYKVSAEKFPKVKCK